MFINWWDQAGLPDVLSFQTFNELFGNQNIRKWVAIKFSETNERRVYEYTLATNVFSSFSDASTLIVYLNVEEREVQRDVEINFDKLADLISEEVSLL